MITVSGLKALGCKTDEGLQRCMNNESFYLMLVNKGLKDEDIANLKAAISSGDLQKGFEVAHAMKGVYGNLSLTPLFELSSKVCEHLRNEEQIDYAPLVDEIERIYLQIKSL
ncbi:MAG: Hpt domain-containing protein [Bacilli bacterium]|nr:Hpt domain-containing protein [Bacilli bacterium]